MAYWEQRQPVNPFGFRVTPWVKRLLIANGVVFLITPMLFPGLVGFLAFRPSTVLLEPWTPLTYMFAHGGFLHLLFNMIILFFFGPPLEERWGSAGFLKYYLVAGFAGAGFSIFFWDTPIIGASGAVYGILFAYAYYWPHNPIYIWGILPVKAWWLAAFVIGISIFYLFTGTATGVAHLAHLGGVVGGYLYLRSPWAPGKWGGGHRGSAGTVGRSAAKPAMLEKLRHTLRRANAEAEEREQRAPKRSRREERELLDDVDRILDKISQSGLQSLSDEERRQLEEMSRKYRA